MRVLLLNPPGREIYIRDYLCSKTSKSSYVYPPIDLVMLSGTVADSYEVLVLDCIAENIKPKPALQRIESFNPEVIVALVASVSWPEDRAFLLPLAEQGRRILVLGDLFHEESCERLREEPWIEAVLHRFTNADVLAYLRGDFSEIEDMTLRSSAGEPQRIQRAWLKGPYRLPRPRHEFFPLHAYRFPFAKRQPFASLLSDYGCPWPCSFCVMSTLGFQQRPVCDVLEEVDDLVQRGVREYFFLDQTFGVQRGRALELCGALAERGGLSWTAFTRPDLADKELLGAMRAAGCHTVILGVESADEALLHAYKKGYGCQAIRQACAVAHELGLRVVGTMMIGLPEQDEDSLERSLAFALELKLDYLSFNVAVPRFGTPFRQRALKLGMIPKQELVMDQGGSFATLATSTLSRRQVLAAKRRLVRRFYLRPSWLLARLRALRNWNELRTHLRQGVGLISRNFGG